MADGMAQLQRKLLQVEELASNRHGKHRLDQMEARLARHLVTFRPNEALVKDMLAKARLEIPGLAETDEVIKVFRYNPEYVLALTRKSKFDAEHPVGEGFVAMLSLNMLGLQHLLLGTFDAACPDTRLLAKPDERPAGVYLWGVYAPGSLVAGMALFMEKMSSPQYEGVDIYSRPNTDPGIRFNHGMGFVKGARLGDIEAPNVWVFSRREQAPIYDNYVPRSGHKNIGITVARTFDDLMRVAAIRNAVYIGEQECPYDEEYDGNDLSATHLLAYMGDEPIGCLRMRFFAGFVKFERMAIRKEFRKSRAAVLLARAGLRLGRKKGYRRAYAHSQSRLVGFWNRFGFHPLEGSKPFVFSDFDYVEIVADLEPDPEAVALGTDPYILIRPEGRWHVSGVLEQSASRAVTNPSIAQKK
jgi:predicted GNAT family N-acyltransferase